MVLWIIASAAWRFAIQGMWLSKQDEIENHMMREMIIQSVIWGSGLICALVFVFLGDKSPIWSARFEWIATNILSIAIMHMVICEYLYDNFTPLP